MESLFQKFWRYENATINLIPIDEANPRQGGKVQVKSFVFDFRTLTPAFQTHYGVYNDEFVTYGTFTSEAGNPLENESVLLKIVQDPGTAPSVVDKTTFRFENNKLLFERDVNAEKADIEINHSVPQTELDHVYTDSWTETLFYGVGNKTM